MRCKVVAVFLFSGSEEPRGTLCWAGDCGAIMMCACDEVVQVCWWGVGRSGLQAQEGSILGIVTHSKQVFAPGCRKAASSMPGYLSHAYEPLV